MNRWMKEGRGGGLLKFREGKGKKKGINLARLNAIISENCAESLLRGSVSKSDLEREESWPLRGTSLAAVQNSKENRVSFKLIKPKKKFCISHNSLSPVLSTL